MNHPKNGDWLWMTVLLSAYAILSIGSARQESATYDEPIHVLAGTVAWKTGLTRLEPSNPPLTVYWQTLPLIALPFHPFPPADQLVEVARTYSFGFVHHNRHSLLWMLQAPRIMNVALALMLGAALFGWACGALGRRAARGALMAYAFCPVLLGYGALVKTDIGGALGWLLVLWTAWRWRQAPSLKRTALFGLAAGFGLCSKYSAILALPAIAGALFHDAWKSEHFRRSGWTVIAAHVMTAALAANVVMMVCFRGWGLPEWLHGIWRLMAQFKQGHANYYAGRFSHSGWPSYFLSLFALKTPLPFLAAMVAGTAGWRKIPSAQRSFLAAWCLWPAALLFLVSSFSTIQVGIRHILPVYPLMCLWVGCAAATFWTSGGRWARRSIIFAGVWYVAGTVAAFPRYLSYFNELVGPSANGYRYFVDSNLDWGQGLKALGDYLRRQGSPPIYLCYFGCSNRRATGSAFSPSS